MFEPYGVPRGRQGSNAVQLIVPGHPQVRNTFQLAATIPSQERHKREAFQEAVQVILSWVQRKLPDIPDAKFLPEAMSGSSFRIELPGQWVEAVGLEREGIWALRLEQPDAPSPYGDHMAVPGRTWITDLSLSRTVSEVQFGCRISCASLPYATAPVTLTRPRVVLELARSVGLTDLLPLSDKAWRLNSETDLDTLRELLVSPSRKLPLTLLTQPDARETRVPVREFVLDYEALAKDLQGFSHVALMPRDLGFLWTERMGRRWTAYNGAVITYRPGMNLQEDPPYLHPKVLLNNILFWRHNDLEGERAFSAFLVEKARAFLADRPMNWQGVAFYPEVRVRQAQEARKKAAENADWQGLYEAEIEALKNQAEESTKQAQQFCDLASRTETERDAVAEENKRLRAALDALRASLRAKTGADPDESLTLPETYEDIPTWVAKELAGRLVLHPRAQNALKDARYEEIGLVVRALLLLAKEYRDSRTGLGKREAFESKAEEHHLRLSGSIDKGRAYQEGEEYFVIYPFGSSRRRFLELHLRKGSTKDDRYCLAIYFFWDDETQQVVVGWLPSHLENRMS